MNGHLNASGGESSPPLAFVFALRVVLLFTVALCVLSKVFFFRLIYKCHKFAYHNGVDNTPHLYLYLFGCVRECDKHFVPLYHAWRNDR